MIEIKGASEFRFRVRELGTEWESFTVLQPRNKTTSEIVEEAARIFFYGRAGWKEGWPLTFDLQTLDGIKISTASVFVLSSEPRFEAIEIEQTTFQSPEQKMEPKERENNENWQTALFTLAVTALITFLLEALSAS